MLQLVLALSVSVVTAAVYGPIGLRWRRRTLVRREILRRLAALRLEPYHAALLRGEATGTAAAELVLAGSLRIDGEGAVFLTEEGRDPGRTPAHPLPAALLEAVRRHDPEPVSIGWIDRCDEEYTARRSAYGSERESLLPELPRMPDGQENRLLACCGCVGIVLAMFFWTIAGVLLFAERPHGMREWACAAVAALGLVTLAFAEKAARTVRARTACEDPLGDLVRAAPHPAFTALDEQQRLHVRRSMADCYRWRGADRVVVRGDDEDDDEWLDDKVWWEDAYEYRVADEDEPGPGPRQDPKGPSSG
ncbi:hypothetical protein DEJ51_06020 [Streptomyces venezuelae]|uniref:Uncharacterized protein n=1 Tax=Streptomyces venezuelae TaxID=54571 RepID=A0A5P2DHZ4_STRVZ|nr:hypothetical protein [Streptomyces venezuelae]QES53857.1 hypothetical protein DEJ51_06020 [Streptomyces venezuelae]